MVNGVKASETLGAFTTTVHGVAYGKCEIKSS